VIAALYIDPRGPYPKMAGVDAWDETRDARLYDGPHPVVAHPPCGPWGALRHLYKGAEHDCAPRAVEQVRTFGGVLEHPRGSKLWNEHGLPAPGGLADSFGGFAVEVDQCAWGHVARKTTWLYVVGAPRETVLAGIRTGGTPTHWASGSRVNPNRPSSRRGTPVPPGMKVCSAQQRRRTPPAFAAWLVEIARLVKPADEQFAGIDSRDDA
jgi:hypothetical protein